MTLAVRSRLGAGRVRGPGKPGQRFDGGQAAAARMSNLRNKSSQVEERD